MDDIRQGAPRIMGVGGCIPTQYDQAMALTLELKGKFGADKLILTGHSLGGGLAAAGAMVAAHKGHDVRAVTFNGAGVHDRTVGSYGIQADAAKKIADKNIVAFRTDKDPLTLIQDMNWTVLGWLMPDGNGKSVELQSDVGLWALVGAGHSIGPIVTRLEKDLANIEREIRNLEMRVRILELQQKLEMLGKLKSN